MVLRYIFYTSLILLQCCAYQNNTNNFKSDTDLYIQIEVLSDSITDKLESNSINKIAVMNYTGSSHSEFESYISDEITLQLFLKEKFQIIEREQLDYVINEQKLGSSGLIDDNSIINIGNILSADAIIVGDISITDDSALINTKVVSTKTGEILFMNKMNISHLPELTHISEISKINSSDNHDSFSSSDPKNNQKSIKRVSQKILSCLREKDYNCFKQFMGRKDDLRKIFLIKHQKDKKLRKTKIKNLNTEYRQYKNKYKDDFFKTIKRLDSRKINWGNLEIKKIDFKIIKNYDQKKLFKVDMILTDKKKRIHIGFNAFKLNGKWIINSIDVKRKK